MTELSIMMPCYEEAENLNVILPEILKTLEVFDFNSEVLILDTHEKLDNTEDVCSKYQNKNEKIKIKYINRRGGNDYGDAVRTGIGEASGKYIINMDADGSHVPADISRLYNAAIKDDSGVVIGSRYIKGGKTDNPFILIFMSLILNVCYRIFFKLNVKDVSNSYRIYRAEKIKNIKLVCENFDIVEEILIKLRKKYPDLKISEIPVAFNKRIHGKSKRDLIRFIFSYIGTMYRLKKLQISGQN